MKSRKSGMFAKRSSSRGTAAKLRETKRIFRRGMVEQLEDRKLMTVQPWSDGMYYPPIGKVTAYLPPSLTSQQYAAISDQQYGTSGGRNLSGEGSGGATGFVTVNEVEPNNIRGRAQVLPLGTGSGQNQRVTVVGNLPVPVAGVNGDEDYFAFDLRAGDILDATVTSTIGRLFDLSIVDANNREIIGNNGPVFAGYPAISPLTIGGNATLAFVIPADGRYYARVSDGDRSYTLDLRVYRPVLESQPIGTRQTIFLDFDGENVRREAFGVPGTARLSPLSSFLPGWGVLPQDEGRIIDEIVDIFASKFTGLTGLRATGNNGWYSATGVAGDFDIQILNSKDHADPWGLPNVSRIVIGGTQAELLIPTVGIAESIDVGNFDTAESAVVLLDLIRPLWGNIPRVSTIPLSTVLADATASVAAHEAGHFFGAWHTLNNNASDQIMDTGGNVTGLIGVGPDGIYGTADDVDVQFGTDVYDRFASAIPFGIQNSAAALAAGLSTGTVGGQIRGNVFHDRNINRVRDNGDSPLEGVRVYADLNGNGVFDSNENFALSNSVGDYYLSIPAGTYTIRSVVPSGYRLTTPTSGSITVTVTGNNVVSNINFGQEQLNLNATGVKWNDVNGNGLRDTGEGIISGVRLYLDLDGDKRIDIGEPSARTNDQGQYTLTFPGPGTYQIREVVDPGYVQTFPTEAMDFAHTVVITGNAAVDAVNIAGLNFGNKLTVDFGDAPATYGDASAGFTTGLRLGANWDDEQASQFSATANGDDSAGPLDINDVVIDDEDGVVFTRPLVRGSDSNRIAVTAENSTGASAYFSAWVDFNLDGDFNDAGEKVISDSIVGTGTSTLTFAAPANAVLGNTFARFRYSNQLNIGPTGRAAGGEVEDYQVRIVPTLDLATNDRFTVSRNSVLNSLDVLANDFALPGEALEIVTTSGSSAGGIIQVSPTNQILYTPPAGFIGQDTFEYTMRNSAGETDTATVVVDVNLFFENPIAVDDSFDITLNAIDVPLAVLANDIEGRSGALTIIMVTSASAGGQVSIATGGKSLRYTPVRGFNGTETLTYTVADASGNQTTARVTIQIVPFVNANTDVVYRLRTTDLNGNEISAIPQGQDFKLEVLVDDFRNDRGAPSSAPGVFAAYMDLLYNLQLVSTAIPDAGATLNFDVDFFNGYTNSLSGDATIPGIIDEFGAFNTTGNNADPGTMNFPNEVRLASITFTARSPGVARFSPNPADVRPANDTLLFDTSGSAVPIERIRYLGTSIEIVGNSDEFPFAVDDSVAVPFGAIRFPIPVGANDLPGSTGSFRVVAASNGLRGTTSIDSQGRVLYTPDGGFTGTDQFTYTIEDARSIRSQAKVTVRVGNADANDVVDLRMEVTDLNGTPITDITVGSQFQLRGYVRDLRAAGANRGVFAAYQDVLYSSALVNPISTTVTASDPLGFQVAFGNSYNRLINGDITNRGIINELGAVQNTNADGSASPLGSGEFLMFTVTMIARAVGTATFVGDPADVTPLHDTLTFDPAAAVPFDQIRFGSDTLTIRSAGNLGGGEFTNPADRHDVNGDGYVSPIDALIVINFLNGNRGNGGALGEGEGSKYFIDVNGDNRLSPLDALLVINRLNANRRGSGEGEGEGGDAILQVLSSGALAKSNSSSSDELDVSGELVEDLSPAVKSSIGARDTGVQYGPFFSSSDSDATDSVFAEGESAIDDLLAQLAPDIEETRKKR